MPAARNLAPAQAALLVLSSGDAGLGPVLNNAQSVVNKGAATSGDYTDLANSADDASGSPTSRKMLSKRATSDAIKAVSGISGASGLTAIVALLL